MNLFEEMTVENLGEETNMVIQPEDITVEHAIEAAQDATALEFEIEKTLEDFSRVDAQVDVLMAMDNLVTENYGDDVADMYALSLTLLSRANGIPDGTFVDVEDVLTIEEEGSDSKADKTESAMDKVKAFAKNVYASLKIMITKFVGFVRKWIAKTMVVLLKGDAKRKELATKVSGMVKDALKVKLPEGLISKAINVVKKGDETVSGKDSSAILTFTKEFTPTDGVITYKDIKDVINKPVEDAEDGDEVVYQGRGVFTVIINDMTKVVTRKLKDKKLKAGDTIGDAGVEVTAVVKALKIPAKELQKIINDKYDDTKETLKEMLDGIKDIEDKEELIVEKQAINTLTKVGFMELSAIPREVNDAVTIANIIIDGVLAKEDTVTTPEEDIEETLKPEEDEEVIEKATKASNNIKAKRSIDHAGEKKTLKENRGTRDQKRSKTAKAKAVRNVKTTKTIKEKVADRKASGKTREKGRRTIVNEEGKTVKPRGNKGTRDQQIKANKANSGKRNRDRVKADNARTRLSKRKRKV